MLVEVATVRSEGIVWKHLPDTYRRGEVRIVKAATEYKQYGITKRKYQKILSAMLSLSEKELLDVAAEADEWISDYLCESIRYNISYEKLEQKYGMLPVSKSDFYRKRRLMFHIMDMNLKTKGYCKSRAAVEK